MIKFENFFFFFSFLWMMIINFTQKLKLSKIRVVHLIFISFHNFLTSIPFSVSNNILNATWLLIIFCGIRNVVSTSITLNSASKFGLKCFVYWNFLWRVSVRVQRHQTVEMRSECKRHYWKFKSNSDKMLLFAYQAFQTRFLDRKHMKTIWITFLWYFIMMSGIRTFDKMCADKIACWLVECGAKDVLQKMEEWRWIKDKLLAWFNAIIRIRLMKNV